MCSAANEEVVDTIRPAHRNEAALISSLALRSKAHWNYSKEQLDVFAHELTIRPEDIADRRTHVVERDGIVVGFYTLRSITLEVVELEHLFIEPTRLHSGLGRLLFAHASQFARHAKFSRLVVQSDPNAAGFYSALGATLERYITSSIPGRLIPLFYLKL